MIVLSDAAAERAVLAGLCKFGQDAYLEVADIITESTFTVDSNVVVYKCLKTIFDREEAATSMDVASIFSAAEQLGLSSVIQKKEEVQHLKAIIDFPVNLDNVRKFGAKIRKLEITRLLRKQLDGANDKLLDVNGTESIGSILAVAEDAVFDFTNVLNDTDNKPETIGSDIDEYVKDLVVNKVDQVGIPTGFHAYDQAIGGGLRKSTVNVIAARPKTGKTLLSDNMGFYIASQLKIPVLNMDTEMTKEDHINRVLAMMTEVEINEIETGKFAEIPAKKEKIKAAMKELKDTPYYHKSIAGKSFEDQVSIMRRWLVKEVGLNDDGTAKDCVVFYDYLKLMDTQGMSADLKEYQLLGFMMTQLHNFASKYKIPIMAFIQLNRDGITKESTDTASGSDRIIWLCSNFSIFKRKSSEEISEDGSDNGNRKLVPLISRHGGGLDDNDYINCNMKGWCAKITEGKTKLELMNNRDQQQDGFLVEDEDENSEAIPFN
jgi:replicative DNA helicase